MSIGRNDPCPCGSGKKYKRCCLEKGSESSLQYKIILGLVVFALLAGLVLIINTLRGL